jgi:hypothetical protein
MGMGMGRCFMPGMIMVVTAVNPLVIMVCIIRHMAVLVFMGMGMRMPVGMGMGFAVMGMGVFMVMGMFMIMRMLMFVQVDLHHIPPFFKQCICRPPHKG